MNAPLRFALALFSFSALQSWVILIFGSLLVIGILVGKFQLAAVSAVFLVMAPAYAGGLVLRIVSSPMVLHLRPHGRRRILLGATGTITLVALVMTLPVVVFELAGLRIPDKSSVFDLPALSTFLFFWGATALIWVGTFITSRYQLLLALSWIPIGAVSSLVYTLHIPSEQLARVLLVIGAAVWAIFALWYMKTASIVRPGWVSGWLRGQSPLDFGQLSFRGLFRRSGAGAATVSRPIALSRYLAGADSTRPYLLAGTAYALLFALALRFVIEPTPDGTPADYLTLVTIGSASLSYVLVRRARLLWMRAGLDRAGLFALAERHAIRAGLAMFTGPAILLVPMALVQRPDLAAAILLYLAAQLSAAAFFQYAGLAVTRGWNSENILLFVGRGLLFLVMTITLQPHRGAFVWTYLAIIAVFGGLALVQRRHALRVWKSLDWRVVGEMPPTVGRQRA